MQKQAGNISTYLFLACIASLHQIRKICCDFAALAIQTKYKVDPSAFIHFAPEFFARICL
jgi:hypothetical protein